MEDENKKKLINEKITGRKLTPGRVLKYAAVALLCGSIFGAASAYTSAIISRWAETAESQSSTPEETLPSESSETESTGESISESSVPESGDVEEVPAKVKGNPRPNPKRKHPKVLMKVSLKQRPNLKKVPILLKIRRLFSRLSLIWFRMRLRKRRPIWSA